MTSVIHRFTTKFFLILVLLGIAVVPASAALLPPVTDPGIIPSGDTNFFFWNDSSPTPDHANKFATYPQLQDTKLFSAAVTSGGGEKTVGEFITDPFITGRTLAPGLTRYRIYANVTSDVGTTTLNFLPFIHYANGTDERLFFGISRTVDVNSATLNEYLISYARRNYTVFEPGSSLLIRVNASTTSVVSRTINFAVAGTSTASMSQIGYWELLPGVPADTASSQDSGSIGLAVAGGIVGGVFALTYWKRRFKK
jgi:hypothetical protein